jgi:hypothetical protein
VEKGKMGTVGSGVMDDPVRSSLRVHDQPLASSATHRSGTALANDISPHCPGISNLAADSVNGRREKGASGGTHLPQAGHFEAGCGGWRDEYWGMFCSNRQR